jgi:ABC-type multidrug transport system fused ATPase/permease subunit
MWKGTKLLLIECPGTQARYLVAAILAAAQTPVVSTLVSIAVSTPQGQLNVTVATLSVLGTIAVGQLALCAMSESTARMTQIGSVALQRRLAENAVYSADPNTGRLTSTFAQGIAKMQSLWTMVYWSLVFSVLQLALNIGFMCRVDYVIGIVALSGLQLIFLVQRLKRKADRLSKEYAKALAQQQTMLENLISLRTAARTRRAGWWLLERWDVLADNSGTTLYLSQLFSNLFNSSFSAMGYGVYVFLLGGIYMRYNQGMLTQEQTFASVGYLLGIVGPINALGSFSSRVIWSAGPITNVYTLTAKVEPGDSKPDKAHGARPSARHLLRKMISRTKMSSRNSSAGAGTYTTSGDVKGPRVLVGKLVFHYSGAKAPTLKGVSCEVNSGEFVALVGGSGSGKTTLLKLLGRANNDDVAACKCSGSVTIDGVPADDYLQTAFCTQSFDLLNGTVRDNITFGCAYEADEDVRRAVSLAGLAHVIQAMPQGYDTVIGRGSSVSLSGGQLARLGLARALCCRPRLLLLDEVTSALDPETQQQVLDALHALRREFPITIVLCTHSIKAAEATDRVIMLADGVIAETGSFAELVARRGAFFTLARAHLDAADTDLAGAAPHVAVPVPAGVAGLREDCGPPRDVAGSEAPGIAPHAAPAASARP